MTTQRLEGLKVPLALAGAAMVLFYIGLFVAQPLLSAVILRMPENYEYLARRFLDRGEYDRAIQACQREIAGKQYNFDAYYLLAEILHRAGRGPEALDLLWQLPERYRAVVARHVPSRGWDEAHLHVLLARVLWSLGGLEESLDQLQMALDCHDPRADAQCAEFVAAIRRATDAFAGAWGYAAEAILDPNAHLDRIPEQMASAPVQAPPNFCERLAQIAYNRRQAALAVTLDAQEFRNYPHELPSLLAHCLVSERANGPGTPDLTKMYSYSEQLTAGRVHFDRQTESDSCLAENSWAHLFRTTVATGQAVLSRKSRGVCLIARATVCDDVWPILSIRVNGKMVGQRYICSSAYQVYTLPLELESGIHSLGVGFENDASNPITKRDRNLEIHEIRFY